MSDEKSTRRTKGQVYRFQLLLFNFEGPKVFNGDRESISPIKYGGVAQLGEHLLCKQGVIGSIPFISTMGMWGRNQIPRNGLIAQPVRAHA